MDHVCGCMSEWICVIKTASFCQQRKEMYFTQSASALLNVRREPLHTFCSRDMREIYHSSRESLILKWKIQGIASQMRNMRQVESLNMPLFTGLSTTVSICVFISLSPLILWFRKCKLVEVHCDRYAFILKNKYLASFFCDDDSYIHIQCIYKYLSGHVLQYQNSKRQKMTAVCLLLNKSLQMCTAVFCEFVHLILILKNHDTVTYRHGHIWKQVSYWPWRVHWHLMTAAKLSFHDEM